MKVIVKEFEINNEIKEYSIDSAKDFTKILKDFPMLEECYYDLVFEEHDNNENALIFNIIYTGNY